MEWPEPVERVAAALRAASVEARLEEFKQGTATAAEAAEALGCEPAQIVKSLVFVCDGLPVLVLVPGDRRGDAAKIARATAAVSVRTATRDEVRETSGFEPGAVAPFALAAPVRVVVEQTLLGHELVWVGAGSSRHLAALAPADLVRLCSARPADVVE